MDPSIPSRAIRWSALDAHAARLAGAAPADLTSIDPGRFTDFSAEACGLLLDYTRQRLDRSARADLLGLADAVDLRGAIDAMFRGDPVNTTENRPALHVALRQPQGAAIGGAAIERAVLAERQRMLEFASQVRDGQVCSSSGQPFTRVVNIGIGGSDLGPAMAVEALRPFTKGAPSVSFVSNVDGCALVDLFAIADPATTLFIIASKTFTTQETMANAATARAWIRDRLGEAAVPAHFAAVSVNKTAMDAFGVHPDYRFVMWDWVGGRYSLWSSIGVSLAIAIGRENFESLLAGGHEIDTHFRQSPWDRNLPALLGLLAVWNNNFQQLPSTAILPYDSRLARFPAFLQQLDMESLGKSVSRDGRPLNYATGGIIWGEPGNNAQHSFFQLLHQGTPRESLEFLLPVKSSCGLQSHQDLAIANCLAQLDAFWQGQRGADVPSHRVHPGGRPGVLLLFKRLDPITLGRLVALYEHKVYVQSVVWGINPFDQWGVELGKRVCSTMLPLVTNPLHAENTGFLASVLRHIQAWR
jgi:glucose-6-phosphate isomerase